MKKKREIIGLTTAVSLCITVHMSLASGSSTRCIVTGQGNWTWGSELEKRAKASFAPSISFRKDQAIAIEALVGDDGNIYDPRPHFFYQGKKIDQADVDRYFGSNANQMVADCLQSVLGASRYAPRDQETINTGRLQLIAIHFNDTSPRISDASSLRINYLKNFKQTDPMHCVIFRIPLDVLQRYPGLFTQKELLTSSNLMLKIGVSEIPALYADWVEFFAEHPNATRTEILKKSGISMPDFPKAER